MTKTHQLHWMKKESCPVFLGLSILVAGSNSWSLQASLFAQMVVEEKASLKPDSITARIRQQTEHLEIELASKQLSDVVGSIWQACVGISYFPVRR